MSSTAEQPHRLRLVLEGCVDCLPDVTGQPAEAK
jgi:hypothetical protein